MNHFHLLSPALWIAEQIMMTKNYLHPPLNPISQTIHKGKFKNSFYKLISQNSWTQLVKTVQAYYIHKLKLILESIWRKINWAADLKARVIKLYSKYYKGIGYLPQTLII